MSIKPGIYRHFKGRDYLLLAEAVSSSDYADRFAVYRMLGGEQVFVRPLEEFFGNVYPGNGAVVPRFRKLDADETVVAGIAAMRAKAIEEAGDDPAQQLALSFTLKLIDGIAEKWTKAND